MKLDDEMRAAIHKAIVDNRFDTIEAIGNAVGVACYRMGLERAAKVCDEAADYWSRRTSYAATTAEHQSSALAAAIREMAHD